MMFDGLMKLSLTEFGAEEDAFRFTIMIMTMMTMFHEPTSWLT
jgi:hypothetical protein